MTQQMVGTLLLGTVYVSPINSCVYSSVNERDYWGRYNLYYSVNGRDSTIGDGIC